MSRTTVYLDEDEFWPWVHFDKRRFGTPVVIDRETAERWERGIAAAQEIQDEMSAALEAAREAIACQP